MSLHRLRAAPASRRPLKRALGALALSLAALTCTTARADDCFEQAAVYQGVNPLILRAVAWHESKGDPAAVNRNSNGSIDVGQAQINSVHFSDLKRLGIPHRRQVAPSLRRVTNALDLRALPFQPR